jgi:hypothetical protein
MLDMSIDDKFEGIKAILAWKYPDTPQSVAAGLAAALRATFEGRPNPISGSVSTFGERHIVDALEAWLQHVKNIPRSDIRREASVEGGRIDLLTPHALYEVKHRLNGPSMRRGMGQLCYYHCRAIEAGLATPDTRLVLTGFAHHQCTQGFIDAALKSCNIHVRPITFERFEEILTELEAA